MTRKFACFLSHGLFIGNPVDKLAAFLNSKTPDGIHFNVVGGFDPQPLQGQITQQVITAHQSGAEIIFGGHSKGAMLAFYLADHLKSVGIRAPLFISLDSTNWGSNVPGTAPWAVLFGLPDAGKWLVPSNVDRWLHFWQPTPPGGGQATLAPGNTTTNLGVHQLNVDHLRVPTAAEQLILDAVLQIAGQAVSS
jgi:hypothetical protein